MPRHPLAAVLILAFLLLPALPSLGQATQPWRPEMERAVHEKLDRPLTLEFGDVSPFDALRRVAAEANIELTLWEGRLRRRGLEDGDTVSLRFENQPARAVVESILHQINDRLPIFSAGYEVYDGRLVVADEDYLLKHCSPLVLYDLRQLDAARADPLQINPYWLKQARATLSRTLTPRPPQERPFRGGLFASDHDHKYEWVADLIQSSVGSPMDWRDNNVHIQFTDNDLMAVRARPSWHQNIAWILDGLAAPDESDESILNQLRELLVLSHLTRAEQARQALDWATAEREIDGALRIAPDHPTVQAIAKIIRDSAAARHE